MTAVILASPASQSGRIRLSRARSDVFAADIAGQGHDPETVLRGLLQHHDVIAGQPRLDRHDDLAARRMLELPGRGVAGPAA